MRLVPEIWHLVVEVHVVREERLSRDGMRSGDNPVVGAEHQHGVSGALQGGKRWQWKGGGPPLRDRACARRPFAFRVAMLFLIHADWLACGRPVSPRRV